LAASPWMADNETGQHENVSVLLTTPYMDEASRCHRVGFMRHGRIIAEGTPSQLRASIEGRILELRGDSLVTIRELVSGKVGIEDVRLFGDRLHLRLLPGSIDAVMAVLQKAFVDGHLDVGIRPILPTLEDVFMMLAD